LCIEIEFLVDHGERENVICFSFLLSFPSPFQLSVCSYVNSSFDVSGIYVLEKRASLQAYVGDGADFTEKNEETDLGEFALSVTMGDSCVPCFAERVKGDGGW
jgi:hypothetical protein